MNNLFTLLFSLIPFFLFAYWSEVPTPTNEDLNKIEIVNGTAFCIGNNGILLKSSNLGDSWSFVSTSATSNITSIKFTNSTDGYFTTSSGKIYKTTNGGNTWSFKNVHEGGLNAIDFLNNTTGITGGDNGIFYKTLDGGSSWVSLGSKSIYAINDLTFINDTLVVAVGPNGSILYSGDTGESWSIVPVGITDVLNAIEKINNETAAIVGSNGRYIEFNATDLTASNSTQLDINGDWLRDVHSTEKSSGYTRTVIVGYSNSYFIENNGWKERDLDSVNNFTGIHYFNDTVGVICGHHGKIYKTISGGVPHSIPTVSNSEIPIYPNPVESYINIGSKFKNSLISIYSLDSKLVLQTNMIHNTLDVSALPNGSYIIKGSTQNKIYFGKFVVK